MTDPSIKEMLKDPKSLDSALRSKIEPKIPKFTKKEQFWTPMPEWW